MMENEESILHALQEFDAMAEKVVSPELEQLLCYIAKTGMITYPWNLLKPLFKVKLDKVMRDFFEASPSRNGNTTQPTQTTEFEIMRLRLLDCLESFDSAPFTVQRLCELMVEPRKHYRNSEKFMRGVEKNVLVVSTVETNIGSASDLQTNNNESHVVPSLVQSTLGMPNGILSEDEHIHVNGNREHHQHSHIDVLGRSSPLNSFLDNESTLHASEVTQEEITETSETRTNLVTTLETCSVLEESSVYPQNTENIESEVRIPADESVSTEKITEFKDSLGNMEEGNSDQGSADDDSVRKSEDKNVTEEKVTDEEQVSAVDVSIDETNQEKDTIQEETEAEVSKEIQPENMSSSDSNKETTETVAEEPMDQD